jgi:hypothetical protein
VSAPGPPPSRAAAPAPPASAPAPTRDELAAAFRGQARGCATSGSPVYAALLARAADDLEAGGVFAEVVSDFRGHPVLDALALRILGAVHGLVLEGRAPRLAAYYPSAGGRFEAEAAWQALHGVVAAHRDALRAAAVSRRVQTNEVRRSAVLLGGFLRVAREAGLPLRLREIGASAGLNLVWDRYRYALGPHRWGDPAAAVLLETEWTGSPPDLDAPVRIASRAGCDLSPVDTSDADACHRLESFVWPDQPERLALLRAALAAVRADPPPIEATRAGDWVARELATPAPGEATVLFQSVVWWYLPEAERARITADVHAAGARARADAPLAWLRMEGASLDAAELRLACWPGADDRLLARVHYHGRFVHWEAS